MTAKSSTGQGKHNKKKRGIFKKAAGGAGKIVLLLVLFVLLVVAAAGSWFYFRYGKTILKLQNTAKRYAASSNIETFRQSQTSLVYAADGTLI